jgi:phosphomevalonate kinase
LYSYNFGQLESLNLPRTLASLSQIPPFNPTGVRLANVHKTGLGSSAALITSLVSALLLHFTAIPRETFSEVQSEGRKLAHNLAQYVHCLAQGKVGSGFDVSSAVFGSQIYTRFDPSVLRGLMNDDEASAVRSLLCFGLGCNLYFSIYSGSRWTVAANNIAI